MIWSHIPMKLCRRQQKSQPNSENSHITVTQLCHYRVLKGLVEGL